MWKFWHYLNPGVFVNYRSSKSCAGSAISRSIVGHEMKGMWNKYTETKQQTLVKRLVMVAWSFTGDEQKIGKVRGLFFVADPKFSLGTHTFD